MRALRRVVDIRPRPFVAARRAHRAHRTRRTVAACALAAVAAGGLAGCAKFDAALGKQTLVVAFHAGTPQAAMMKVRSACSTVAGATPEAVPTNVNATSGTFDVRYDISQASDADIARLEQCLSKYHSVQGISIQQAGGE